MRGPKRMTTTTSSMGSLLATALRGAWREPPPPVAMSADELGEIAPLLLETGGGALGWWRFRHSPLATSPAGERLKMAYRLHTLQAAVHERDIARVVDRLRSVGLDPVLAKGWAIARLYPETGLRPYGDIDLLVGPEAFSGARLPTGLSGAPVDFHRRFAELDDRPLDELYRRSQLVSLGDVDVRILGAEDHLRFSCLHLLKHGFWRPTWLCDVGVALDCLPADFDWDYFLDGKDRRSRWVVCVLLVAQQLLGARLDGLPAGGTPLELPDWLIPSVLAAWESGHPPYQRAFISYLRRPAGVMQAVRQRWPSRIQASARWRTPSSKLPAPPVQAWEFTARAIHLLLRRGRVRPETATRTSAAHPPRRAPGRSATSRSPPCVRGRYRAGRTRARSRFAMLSARAERLGDPRGRSHDASCDEPADRRPSAAGDPGRDPR